MIEDNRTSVTEFLLLGFPRLYGFRMVFFLLILIIYIVVLTFNFMTIFVVSTRPRLHAPMFYFLKHLSFTEILFSTIIVPNMLYVVWLKGATISRICCITQTYLYVAVGSTECFLLMVMSYDRYLAICNPLRYNTIMDFKFQHSLALLSWTLGFLFPLITLILLCQIKFCGPKTIDNFFCDLVIFIEISCSHTKSLEIDILVLTFPIAVVPFILIISSYICVFRTILRISTNTGRSKAFSTCSSHLSVVSLYFGTIFSIYLVPTKEHSLLQNKVIMLMCIVVTPLFNPIIYCLRNQEIRAVIGNLICKKRLEK